MIGKKKIKNERSKVFFSKKAMSMGFLVAIIIVIASFMLLAATIARFYGDADEKEAEALCQSSVGLRATAAISLGKGAAEARISPLLCKTIDKEVSGDRGEVQKAIADKMAKCWDMFGAGQYDTSIFENINLFGHNNNCFVCYTIGVEKVLDENGEGNKIISPLQFNNFLQTEKIKGTTYLDYIQHDAGGQGYVATFLTDQQGITEDRAYGIVYKGKKGKCEGCSSFAIGGAVLALPAALVGLLSLPVSGAVAGVLAIAAGTGVGVEAKVIFSKVQEFLRADQAKIDGILLIDLQSDSKAKESSIASTVFEECNYVPDIAGK